MERKSMIMRNKEDGANRFLMNEKSSKIPLCKREYSRRIDKRGTSSINRNSEHEKETQELIKGIEKLKQRIEILSK